jgi:hypothetical protein
LKNPAEINPYPIRGNVKTKIPGSEEGSGGKHPWKRPGKSFQKRGEDER